RLCRSLPHEWDIREMGRQLLRSGTSVAANYRARGRARSHKEFCSKLGVVVEEADESQLWLELLPEADPTIANTAHGNCLRKRANPPRSSQHHTGPRGRTFRRRGLTKRKGARKESHAPELHRRDLGFWISRFPNSQISKSSSPGDLRNGLRIGPDGHP